MTTKKRLLAVGPGNPSTGFGRVFRSILEPLCDTFLIIHFSPNLLEAPPDSPYVVLPRQIRGDVFGREHLPQLLADYDPDFVLLFHDPPFYSVHREAIQVRKTVTGGRPFVAFYCPIEWENIPPGTLQEMADLDALVLYNQFGSDVVRQAFGDCPMPPTHIIPHGVDLSAFYPHDGGQLAARQQLFPDRPDLENAFIVLNANRNCPRKQIELTLRGFALFARQHSDVWLYLHMGTKDSGCDVLALAAELGIEKRLLMSHRRPTESNPSGAETTGHPNVSDAELNLIYNACDVGLNTSAGEGWGLVAFEHAATGAPQIVPDHSACREHWQGRGVLIPLANGLVTPQATAMAIERLYQDSDLRMSLGQAGREYANNPAFRWPTIAEQWRQLLN